MAGRHLLEYSYSTVYIPIGSIIAFICLVVYGLCKCAGNRTAATAGQLQDSANEPGDIEVQATTLPSAPPNSATTYPQFASATYSSGVVHVPAAGTFDGYSPERRPFTRSQIEAMSVHDLKILKQRLNME